MSQYDNLIKKLEKVADGLEKAASMDEVEVSSSFVEKVASNIVDEASLTSIYKAVNTQACLNKLLGA